MGAAPGPGDEIGGFRLVKLIGRGAFGSVFEAEEQQWPRPPRRGQGARGRACGDERYRRRFVAETRALAVLERHPHVVPVYGAGEDRGVLYIAMLLVESDLRAVLARERHSATAACRDASSARSPRHSTTLTRSASSIATSSLRTCSSRSLVVAPHCYVTDFGIASAPEPADSTTGGLGGPRGTYAYMAPETIEARPSRDGRGDGYSLACVAHECLCGSAFFQRASEPATMMAQLKETAPPLAGELGLVRGVDTVLARELEKDPSRRFATCSSFAEALSTELARAPRPRDRVGVACWPLRLGVVVVVCRSRRPSSPAADGGTSGTLPRWGSPQLEPPLTVPASAVASLTVADLNGDGRRTSLSPASNAGRRRRSPVSILLTEDAPLSMHTQSLVGHPIREIAPSAVVVDDLTGDGRSDVLLADSGGPDPVVGGVTLLVRDGQSIRVAARPPPANRPSGARPIALADDQRWRPVRRIRCNAPAARRRSCGTANERKC